MPRVVRRTSHWGGLLNQANTAVVTPKTSIGICLSRSQSVRLCCRCAHRASIKTATTRGPRIAVRAIRSGRLGGCGVIGAASRKDATALHWRGTRHGGACIRGEGLHNGCETTGGRERCSPLFFLPQPMGRNDRQHGTNQADGQHHATPRSREAATVRRWWPWFSPRPPRRSHRIARSGCGA